MGILSDRQIRNEVKIEPMAENVRRPGVISYGLSSYGYDVRLGYKFKVFKPYPCTVIDPKNFDPRMLEEVDLTPGCTWQKVYDDLRNNTSGWQCVSCGIDTHDIAAGQLPPPRPECENPRPKPDFITIPPHSFVLGESLETFWIPRDLLCVVVGKSTYARCGLIVNVTPGEPEWGGKWTIEISNTTPLPAKVYAGEGIMQCLFFRSDGDTENIRYVLKSFAKDIKNNPQMLDRAGTILLKMLEQIEQPSDKNGTCDVSYADRKGKYQDQTGVTTPTVDKGN